jgi:hypothetical protein
MKLELVKQTKEGKTVYYTTKDGNYVSGSLYFDLEQAERYYNIWVEQSSPSVTEVIKSTEI